MALAGAISGAAGKAQEAQQEQERLRQQKQAAWSQYLLGQAYSDEQYEVNRREARETLAIRQDRLDESVDMSAGQFNASLLAQAYGIQDARIQAAAQTGASRAAEGMSGTRGNGAGELARAYAETSLGRNIGLQYRQNELALAGMTGQANNAAADIRRERASWDPGGYRYNLKGAQDAYNRNAALLGQSGFDWQIGSAAATPLDITAGTFGGLSSGLSLGSSFLGMADLFGAPNAAAGTGSLYGTGGVNGNAGPRAYVIPEWV
jgi:hypothetical protein